MASPACPSPFEAGAMLETKDVGWGPATNGSGGMLHGVGPAANGRGGMLQGVGPAATGGGGMLMWPGASTPGHMPVPPLVGGLF
jgi:hypothetical protein